MRILGLDYGDKTIGVAISDPFGWTAQGLEVIRRNDEAAINASIKRLSEIIDAYEVTDIVLGYPKNMNNTEGPRCEKTLLFKEKLQRNFKKIKITLVDERLSTQGSERSLLEANVSRRKRSQVIDKMAAIFILQGYLDLQKNKQQNIKKRCIVKMSKELDEMDDFDDLDEEFEIITMSDEDGFDTEFAVMDVVELAGNKYFLVVEMEQLDDDEADAALLKEVSSNDDEAVYEFVENEEELQKVYAILKGRNDDYDIEF